MANLKLQWIPIWNCPAWMCGILPYFVTIATILGPIELTRADPITFRFDATITHALPANPFDLPFDYQVGDVFSGTLTFEPANGVPTGSNAVEANQFLGLEFTIDGKAFGSSTYSIRAINDTVILDSDPFLGTVDTMTIRCSPSDPQPCMPALITLPGGDPFSVGVRLQLTGDGSILSIPQISPDPRVWNSFSIEKSLALSFRGENSGSVSIFATVHSFTYAPEPSTSCLVLILMPMTGWRRRRANETANDDLKM